MKGRRTGVSFLVFILIILSFSIPSTMAEVGEVWVDDDGIEDSTHFLTIWEGIDALSVGGTVHVATGTYEEAVLIDKSLTLEGEDRETTEIRFGYSKYPSKSPLTIFADGVTVSGFTIRSGPYIEPSWTVAIKGDSALLSDLHVIKESLLWPNNKPKVAGAAFGFVVGNIAGFTLVDSTVESAWNGIYTRGTCNNIVVRNVDFTYPGEYGIFLKTITGATIEQSTFICTDDKYGVIVTRGSHDIYITDNQFIGSDSTADSHVGIILQAWSPHVMGDVGISKNEISDFKIGVKIEHVLISGIHINYNSITGNAYGVVSAGMNPLVDATMNWWGTIVKSEIETMIEGDVSFEPYASEAFGSESGSGSGVSSQFDDVRDVWGGMFQLIVLVASFTLVSSLLRGELGDGGTLRTTVSLVAGTAVLIILLQVVENL